MYEHMLLHIRQNNKHQVSQKTVFPDDGPILAPKNVEIDKYTKNKLCTKLALFTRLHRDARSTKHTIFIQYHKKYKRFCIVMHGFKMLFFKKKKKKLLH